LFGESRFCSSRIYLFYVCCDLFLPRARILFRFRGESVELCLLISFLFFFWGFFPFVIFLFLTVHCCFAALPLFRNRQYFSVHNRCWCYILKGVSCGNNAFFRLGGAFGGGVLHRLALLQNEKKRDLTNCSASIAFMSADAKECDN